MRRPSRSAIFVRPLWLAVLAAVAPTVAGATSYTITTFADDAVVNGNCTLREAIRASDTNAAVDACAAGGASDSITLPSGTYPFYGSEELSGGGTLSIQSQTLNPFHVGIDLNSMGRFISLQGAGAASYILGGLEIRNGLEDGVEDTGGAIRAFGVSLRIFNFRFVSNAANRAGGALYFYSAFPGANLSLTNGSFLTNSVTYPGVFDPEGGALVARVREGANAEIRDVTFIGNSVATATGAPRGGALSVEAIEAASVLSCVRCNFQNNSVQSTAISGSMNSEGGALSATAGSGGRVEVVDGRFIGNWASGTPTAPKVAVLMGVASDGGVLVLERLLIDFNGGSSDTFTHDVALRSYDVVSSISLVDSQVTFGSASGLDVQSSSPVSLGHLTVADYPLQGARLFVGGPVQFLLQNSILAFNGTDLVTSGDVLQTTNFVGGDPLFVDEPNGDYHLSAASPAINAGTNSAVTVRLADLDHRGRRAGPATDIGCYEVNGLFAHGFDEGDLIDWSATLP